MYDSFVEANLFIICGSLPTIRKFFKHFAPKLVGSSSLSHGSLSYPTHGSSRRRDATKLEDTDLEMDAYTSRMRPTNRANECIVDVSAGSEPDDISDTAILRTTSYRVHYN